MKRYQNLLMLIAVGLLIATPLWMVRKPVPSPDGKKAEIFRGADEQAEELIAKIAPGYRPWFKPLMEPPSEEIGSLLFALQAALGAGFIGYYLGVSTARERMRRELSEDIKC